MSLFLLTKSDLTTGLEDLERTRAPTAENAANIPILELFDSEFQ